MRHAPRRLAALLMTVLFLLPLFSARATPAQPAKVLTVLLTHDMHDRVYPDAQNQGGWVRLATALQEERAQASNPTVTLDGGDFAMGSLFQTIYATDAPELRLLGQMGYDVATLGNHEFDYRLDGFTDMLNAAVDSGETLPQLVVANYKPPADAKEAWNAWNRYGVKEYTLLEKDGISIAVFGLMGYSADEYAPMSGMEFEEPVEAAKRVVAAIEADGGADFVICLSHAGTYEGKGEDYTLAQKVKGIDLIVSGHTHTTLEEPIQVGDTFIVSAGAYTQSLGKVTLSKTVDGAASLMEYSLLPIDNSLADDPALTAAAQEFQTAVETGYLAEYGLEFDQNLVTVKGDAFTEEQMGNLIGDSYISAVKTLEGTSYVPVDFAVTPAGVIRDVLRPGAATTAEVFNILSLGIGEDGAPGYPLISAWLTGKDLKNAFEVDASIAPFMDVAKLYGAGMTWSVQTHRMLLDKVTDCGQILPDGTVVPLEDDRLYRVVADLYSGQMLGAVEGKSLGLLSMTLRDAQGNPVEDLETLILTRPDGGELKAWYALASYLQGEGTVTAPEARKTAGESWNPLVLLAHPGPPTLIALGVLLLLVALIVLVVWLVVRRRRKRGYHTYRGR